MVQSIFHLRPEKNWINDPNGLAFIQGKFHMFYQHNPDAPIWGNMTWGHAVSPDMVHWQRLPHALYPDMQYDKDGVFSGCCVVHDGKPHILYTGVYPETLCLAIGDEQGKYFKKYQNNPILTCGERELKGWRDPFVWKEKGSYRMLIGAADCERSGFCEIYEGNDLINWNLIGRFAGAKEYNLPDHIWECPVLLIDNQWAVLFISAPFTVRTFTGQYNDSQIGNCTLGFADLGDSLYAPNLVRHPDGRWILFGWERECGDETERAAQGWQGMLSIPREVSICNGRLRTRPAEEVMALRQRHLLHLEAAEQIAQAVSGQHCEIDARLDFSGGGSVVFDLLQDQDGASVRVQFNGDTVRIQRGKYAGGAADELTAKVDPLEKSRLRIYLDGTSIEIFINERETLTTRAYPEENCNGFRAQVHDGCKFEILDLYTMKSSY